MSGLFIRRAVAADATPFRQVVIRAYAPYRKTLDGMPDVSAGLAEDIRDHDVWVAEDGRRVIGGAVLVQIGGRAKLANLAVDPDCAGKGAGAALVACVEDAARQQGHVTLDLITHVAMIRTQAFYARLGWTQTARDDVRVTLTKSL